MLFIDVVFLSLNIVFYLKMSYLFPKMQLFFKIEIDFREMHSAFFKAIETELKLKVSSFEFEFFIF